MKTITSVWSYLSEAWASGRPPWKCCLMPAASMLPGADLASHRTGRFTRIALDGSLADWHRGDVHYSAAASGAGVWLNAMSTNVFGSNDFDCIYAAL